MLNRLLQQHYRAPNNGRQVVTLPNGRRAVLRHDHPWKLSPATLRVSDGHAPACIDDLRPVPGPPLPDAALGACMAIDAEGLLHIAWSAERGVEWTCCPAAEIEDAASWAEPQLIVPAEGAWLGDIVSAGERLHLTFRLPVGEARDALGLAVRAGGGWDTHLLAQPRPIYPPVAGLGPEGHLHLAWHDVPGRAWYARMAPDGSVIDGPLVVDDYGRQPAILSLGEGALIAYEDDYPHIHWALVEGEQVVRREHLTMLHPWFTGDLCHSPQLARDRHGVIWLVFADNTRGCTFWTRWLGDGFSDVHNGPRLFVRPPHFDVNLLSFARLSVQKDARRSPDIGLLMHAEPPAHVIDYRTLSVSDHPEPGDPVMFFDLAEVAEADALELRLCAAEKHPANPLMDLGAPGDFDCDRVFNHGAVLHDGDRFRMWYGGVRFEPHTHVPWWDTIRGGYAESDDGIAWERVEVGLVEDGGSTANNIVPHLRHAPTMIRDDADPDPDRRYKSLYLWNAGEMGEMAREGKYGIDYDPRREEFIGALYVSPDGLHLTPEPVTVEFGPQGVKPFSMVPQGFFRDEREPDPAKRWKAYGFMSLNLRRRGGALIYSADGLTWHWHAENPVLDPRVRGVPATHSGPTRQIHDTVVLPLGGYYVALYQCQHDAEHLDIELAVSRDGVSFVHIRPGEKVIPLGQPGEFDSHSILPSMPVVLEDEIRLYYGGSAYEEREQRGRPSYEGMVCRPGLATLRAHGFTCLALADGATSGRLLSLPLDLSEPCTLIVNAACDAGRTLCACIVDAESREPLRGRCDADCDPLEADDLAHAISWRGEAVIEPTGRPVRVRFSFAGDADLPRLYSYSLQPVE